MRNYISKISVTFRSACEIEALADGIAFSLISVRLNLFPRDIKSNRRNMAENQRVSER